jgi:hypothetical protein
MRNLEVQSFEDTMHDLYANPNEYIPAEDCETGMIYWSNSSQIGQIALCAGVNHYGNSIAIGLAEQQGRLKLGYEFHKDTPAGSHVGYWRPHVALPWTTQDVPHRTITEGIQEYLAIGSGQACTQLFGLLLSVEIEVTKDKLDWLASLPRDLAATHAHSAYIHTNQANLVELESFREKRTK